MLSPETEVAPVSTNFGIDSGIQLDGQVHRTEDCLPNGSWHQQYVKMATRFLDQSWFTGNRVEAFWKLTSVD